MKLIKLAQTGLSQAKEVAGLLSCHIDYEIKSGQGTLDYTGPKFSPAMWHQVLSFCTSSSGAGVPGPFPRRPGPA